MVAGRLPDRLPVHARRSALHRQPEPAGIWIVDSDGGGLRQVIQRTPGTSWDFSPQWSPDGTKLVFVRVDLARQPDAIFTDGVDGSEELQVTPWELNGSNGPDWSADGRWILFTGTPGDDSANA